MVPCDFQEDHADVIKLHFEEFYASRQDHIFQRGLVCFVYHNVQYRKFGLGERFDTQGIKSNWKHMPYAWLKKPFNARSFLWR